MDDVEARGEHRTDRVAASKRRVWRAEECTEDDCDRPPIARNLCSKHYQRRAAARDLPPKIRTRGRRDNPPDFQCAVDGCVVQATVHGLCRRHYSRSRRYGMGLSELAQAEGGVCEGCGSIEDLQVDHCHDSLDIRGILCGNCNKALGAVKDDIRTLIRLAAYLERSTREEAA